MFSLIKQVRCGPIGYKYDIYVLPETYGCDHGISVPGFEEVILKSNKKQHLSGRSAGGRILFDKGPGESK